MRDPKRTLHLAVLTAIAAVSLVYVVVTLGTTSRVGPAALVEHKQVALAVAGHAAMGTAGMQIVSIAAVLSTASAINATVFATGRIMRDVADDNRLPHAFDQENKQGIPDRAVMIISASSLLLAVIGSLTQLVEAASLTFLFTFGVVNVLAIGQPTERRWVAWWGALSTAPAGGLRVWRIGQREPITLA